MAGKTNARTLENPDKCKDNDRRKKNRNRIPLRVCHFGPAGAFEAALAP